MHRKESGFVFVAALFLAAVMAIGMARAVIMSSTWERRMREEELLFVGHQYRNAIRDYYEQSPGTERTYPPTLEALLLDQRLVSTRRPLRRIYADPVTGKPDWVLIYAPRGGIMGVQSRSVLETTKRGGFLPEDQAFTGAITYSQWKFVYEPKP